MDKKKIKTLKRYFHEKLGDIYLDYDELRVCYEKIAEDLGYNSDYIRSWFFDNRIPIRAAAALASRYPDKVKLEEILGFVYIPENLKIIKK